ncbi:hypothetical protein ACFWFQ_09475, partial [Nocardia salmonicida]
VLRSSQVEQTAGMGCDAQRSAAGTRRLHQGSILDRTHRQLDGIDVEYVFTDKASGKDRTAAQSGVR